MVSVEGRIGHGLPCWQRYPRPGSQHPLHTVRLAPQYLEGCLYLLSHVGTDYEAQLLGVWESREGDRWGHPGEQAGCCFSSVSVSSFIPR